MCSCFALSVDWWVLEESRRGGLIPEWALVVEGALCGVPPVGCWLSRPITEFVYLCVNGVLERLSGRWRITPLGKLRVGAGLLSFTLVLFHSTMHGAHAVCWHGVRPFTCAFGNVYTDRNNTMLLSPLSRCWGRG